MLCQPWSFSRRISGLHQSSRFQSDVRPKRQAIPCLPIAGPSSLDGPFRGRCRLQESSEAHSLSACLSLAELSPASSLYCPIEPSIDHGSPSTASLYASSAACALLADQITLPSRLRAEAPGACSFGALAQLLVGINTCLPAAEVGQLCPSQTDFSLSSLYWKQGQRGSFVTCAMATPGRQGSIMDSSATTSGKFTSYTPGLNFSGKCNRL